MINAIFYIWNWYMYLILSKLFLKPNTFFKVCNYNTKFRWGWAYEKWGGT